MSAGAEYQAQQITTGRLLVIEIPEVVGPEAVQGHDHMMCCYRNSAAASRCADGLNSASRYLKPYSPLVHPVKLVEVAMNIMM